VKAEGERKGSEDQSKKRGRGKSGKNKEGMKGGLWRARETQKYREDTMIEM
jgi:hypothetical protein